MDTLKYIIKRLLLSVLILFGVSIIIYGLARMMPTDFVDNQYSSAVSQGTMTQADVDRIKELYGLAMPDSFLSFTVGSGSEFEGVKFQKNAKKDTYDEVTQIQQSGGDPYGMYEKWYVDSYDASGSLRLYIKKNNAEEESYTYQIGTVVSKGSTVQGDVDEDGELSEDAIITLDEVFTPKESGKCTFVKRDGLYALALEYNGQTIMLEPNFRVATSTEIARALFKGYFGWLGNMLKGDLGMSFKYKEPVAKVITENMGISFAIALIATILQFLIAIPLGIKAAVNQYGVIDYTVTIFTMIGISLPTFFLGAIFIRLFVMELHWFPAQGIESGMGLTGVAYLGDVLWHMILPLAVMVILSIGGLMRYTRTNTLEALNADYVRTARAKGLSERSVIYKHAFRNTMIPLVTLLAGILPSLFSGAMITETVFAIPGIGNSAYQALIVADVPFIMGYNMFISVLTVIGTLFSDLMYAVVDPRVKLTK